MDQEWHDGLEALAKRCEGKKPFSVLAAAAATAQEWEAFLGGDPAVKKFQGLGVGEFPCPDPQSYAGVSRLAHAWRERAEVDTKPLTERMLRLDDLFLKSELERAQAYNDLSLLRGVFDFLHLDQTTTLDEKYAKWRDVAYLLGRLSEVHQELTYERSRRRDAEKHLRELHEEGCGACGARWKT